MDAETDREAQLADLLARLTEGETDGSRPSLTALIEKHPEFAEELRSVWEAAWLADLVAAGNPTSTWRASGPQRPELPCRMGDYELLALLGQGGMGAVYKARQVSLDRVVAVKLILSGSGASEQEQARFRAEAEAAAQLDHPHIVPIYEVGEHQGQLFFSMKYVEGETLAARIEQGPLPGREIARWLATVARAVDFAHQRGVLHRDLKPANVLLDRQEIPYVTDFGLAKRFRADEGLTRSGAMLGTPSYMAPEQASPNRGRLGPTCDVYSLGTILYAALTGRPPFQGASPLDTVLMLLEQDPLPPRLLNVKADRELELIAIKCLQKPPELRYPSAGALADDLEAYLRNEPISARSGHFSQIIARLFRETHHATVLEHWGLLWMWHSLVIFAICLVTSWFHAAGVSARLPYLALWGGGLAVWAPIFWALRRRSGPVMFVERQIAHVWGASVIAAVLLFVLEWVAGLPVLSLSPVLGLVTGMVFVVKAGILAGFFYVHAAVMFLTSLAMAAVARYHEPWGVPDFGITLFGVVGALSFFIPGWKYHRQRQAADRAAIRAARKIDAP